MSVPNDYILRYMNDVDLRLLRIFSTIVECGGITAAEAVLNMANSTLSTHLATLEEHLQLKLCQRGRAGFSLTSEGRQVYEAALRMFQSLEDFRRSIPAAHADSRGEIKFLVPDALFCSVIDELTPVFRRFLESCPGVFLDVELASPARIDQLVIDGKVDIGINSSSRRTHNLRFYDVKEELIGLYCGVGHPLFKVPDRALTIDKIREHDVVRAHGYYYPRKVLQALRSPAAASCIPLDGRVLLLATGRYLGIVAQDFARPYEKKGLLRELMPAQFRYTSRTSIITRDKIQKPALGRFLEILDEELRAQRGAKSATGRPV
jgi:DNA-binding transcriptional LysR family regulator